MTEIIIASDSHGRTDLLKKLEAAYPHADVFAFCGDLEDSSAGLEKWVLVRGNNDWSGEMPDEKILRINGHKILMLHSQYYSYLKRKEGLASTARQNDCDIVLYGHTHASDITRMNDVLLINPGSIAFPRDGKEPCYARLLLDDNGQTECEIIYRKDWPFDPNMSQKEKKKRKWWF